ncbi:MULTISPECIES: hypothetical protein [unclassified Novosphingobium]|uniref:hypothetical protein n=1 Tax=unclassified Novosphingobium TaxID=2644732 RepID=UPI00146EDFC3|nr:MULTISPECIES: hypothetical protein [unclassified Novosphingobium]NMN04859.1 hypothetical protein [Novosphingobium sp. SG919]NMN85147.1 hypothetical protein [Novosphingobium sp. SG916]
MAIVVRGKTECSVCGDVIAGSDDIVMFPHFIWDEAHPLWRFSDSAMHRRCFVDWDQAKQFRRIYNETWPEIMPNHRRTMQSDGIIVELG